MELDSETENDILRDLARLQLSKFESSADQTTFPGQDMDKEHTESLSWTNPPSRKARELIVAEEILRFATISDRPVTSLSTRAIQAAPELISVTPSNTTKKSDEATDHLTSEVANGDETPAVNQAPSRSIRIAADAGTSGSQSGSFGVSPPLVSDSPDAYLPVRGTAFPTEPQQNTHPNRLPVFRPNIVPVTNRILAAIAQNESERPSSNSPVELQPTSNGDIGQYWPRNNGQLFGYFIQHLKYIQGSDLSGSSSPDSQAPTRRVSPVLSPSIHNCNDEISSLNQIIFLTTELEETVAKNLQNIKDETGVETVKGGNNYLDAHKYEGAKDVNIDINNVNKEEVIPQEGTSGMNRKGIPLGSVDVDNTYNRPCVRNPNLNISQYFEDDISVNIGMEASDENAIQSEYSVEDESSRTEWTRSEKRRLGTVIRDFSRLMKTKELQKKKSRLLKKGRVIAQAIENKICDIDQEIIDVNKKTLRQVALPLEQIQEYDWVKVASVLNAKRTPEECRTHWKWFLHPNINNGEWTLIEARAMEIIAQRHNFRNWDDIAEELNTGRSGYQCYQFFLKNLCPHLELRGQFSQK